MPFFSLSASEFIEMVVGVGASRVRDLFDQAKKAAPAIIFIDELDAIGRSRGGERGFGGHDEREQTLNQILTEMDGFTGSEGVIVLAATNRPEVLDSALLRPGRFDRRVVVNPPDKDGRRKILEVHTRSVPLADDVDLDAHRRHDARHGRRRPAQPHQRGGAHRPPGASTTRSSSATSPTRSSGSSSAPSDGSRCRWRSASARPSTSPATPSSACSSRAPTRSARSRSSRAVARWASRSSRPRATATATTSATCAGRIVGALGGRAAEEIVYGNVTTGAESDLEQVTNIARQMVGRWGMSDRIGLV